MREYSAPTCAVEAPIAVQRVATPCWSESVDNEYQNGWAAVPNSFPEATVILEPAEFQLRTRLVSGLVRYAQLDFHQPSQTHLVYKFYTESDCLRAVHPLPHLALCEYVQSANALALSCTPASARSWIDFIEANSFPAPQAEEFPCSGVINFRLGADDAAIFEAAAKDLVLSVGGVCERLLPDSLNLLSQKAKKLGEGALGAEVRRFSEQGSILSARQRTVRIKKRLHAALIAKARVLSVPVTALATFVLHLRLTEMKITSASISRL